MTEANVLNDDTATTEEASPQVATVEVTGAVVGAAKGKKDVQYDTVTMSDGKIVDFAGKTRMLKTSVEKDGKLSVRLDFRNGSVVNFALPENLLVKFALHGAEQKLGDEIAGVVDIDDAVIAVEELTARLALGEWNVRREPGNSIAGTSVLARALAESSGKTMDTIKAFLATKTHAEKMALRNMPAIKVIVDRLEAEKVKKSTKEVDTTGLLGELEALGS